MMKQVQIIIAALNILMGVALLIQTQNVGWFASMAGWGFYLLELIKKD
jgi:hypothetical protein